MATLRRLGAALFLAAFLVAAQTAAAQGTASFRNTTPILLPGTGTAAGQGGPYPSEIVVSGMTGVVSDVNVTISDFSHAWAQDVDILLVSPNGSNIIIMSDAVSGTASQPVYNRTYTFDDAGGAVLPTTGQPTSGVYRPQIGGTGDTFNAPAPTPSTATQLATLNGQSPNGTWSLYTMDDAGGDIGQIAGGWSLQITTVAASPSNAVFNVNPGGANVSPAGECTLPGIQRTATLTMSNTGTAGTVNVLSASITGSSAFSIATANPAPPTFPVALTGATTAAIGVAFFPNATLTGPQSAVLTLTYNLDGGATQTRTVPISGQGDSEGAGFVLRSTNTNAACAPGVAAPGTAFVVPATNTRVTTTTSGTLNDGRFDLNLTTAFGAAFPSFRFFGYDRTLLQISTNGVVGVTATEQLPSTTTLSNTYYGGQVLASGVHTIHAAGMNLDLSSAVAADAAGVLGAPGLFYGLADVDSDGDQDLVITWWHAYDNGSTPGATGEYLTAQMILLQANRPNEEDVIEVRFPDGNDANGVAYRQNTTTTTGGDNSIENDAATEILEATGGDAAIYRLRNGTQNAAATVTLGGLLYGASGGSTGVRFQPEIQATASGQAGWRMLGMPLRNYNVNRLAQVNLVQGTPSGIFPGAGTSTTTYPAQYPTYNDNLYTSYDGTGYVAPANTSVLLTQGQGFIWYFFNQNFDPGDTDGTSNSYALPQPLQAVGLETALDAGSGSAGVTLHSNGNGWNLLGNPFRDDLNISNIASWATGGTLASAVGQIWDPNAGATGSYVLTSTAGNLLSAWQGVMIQNNTTGGATALNVPTPRIEGATFYGRTVPPSLVAFELAGTGTENTGAVVDRSAALFIAEDGTAGWDLQDAGKLVPLAARYATIAFVGERNGETVLKAQESRGLGASFSVPMAVSAVGTEAQLTLSWPTFENVPADMRVTLEDLVTGAVVDLRAQESYTFSMGATRPAGTVTAEGMPAIGDAIARVADTRFVIHVTSAVTAGENPTGLPTEFALHTVAPNPIVGVSAAVQFDLPEAVDARVEMFDLVGRRVAVLAEGTREAGTHTARLDASGLASGVYVIRMTAGQFVQAQRVTITP